MLSVFVPGNSVVHRAYTWIKLGLVCVCGTAVMFISSSLILGISLAVVVGLYLVARIPIKVIWRLSRMVVILVAIIAAGQWLFTSGQLAVLVSLRILILVAAANLLTLTTPMSEIIATIERVLSPFAQLGFRPERLGIAIALALRFIPVLVEQGTHIRQAQAARGARSRFTYLVPLIIRTLRMADAVGEALVVRGLDSPGQRSRS